VRNSESLERSEGLTARRRFLLDMAWPVSSELLCHIFGLIDPSIEVRDAERADSDRRMRRLANDDAVIDAVVDAAKAAAQILALVEDPEERAAWLSTYALAVINLLEDLGKLEVAA
jgi:acyl-CoA reductase-like NAD-dependent aldehyde dehydrogenase